MNKQAKKRGLNARQRAALMAFAIVAIPPASYGIGVLIGDRLEKALIQSLEHQWREGVEQRAGGIVRE